MSLAASVILPTHGCRASLVSAVDSILAQSRPPDELIVVNDGPDAVPDALARRAGEAGVDYVSCRRHTPCLPASRNRGIAQARGDVLVFAEDDVFWPTDHLDKLLRLFEADGRDVVAGIGATVTTPHDHRLGLRMWKAGAKLLGELSWRPRVRRAGCVRLPAALSGQLVPAVRLCGGAMALRRDVALRHRFDESFEGWAFAEDLEYSYRVGRVEALFLAPRLVVSHAEAPGGRPDPVARGRLYVRNLVRVADRTVDPGVGTIFLLGYDLLGKAALNLAWSILFQRRWHLGFAAGIAAELLARARAGLRKMACTS